MPLFKARCKTDDEKDIEAGCYQDAADWHTGSSSVSACCMTKSWFEELWKRSSLMREDQLKDLLEKWQILGLSFVMMSKSPEEFHDLAQQEFGNMWDG